MCVRMLSLSTRWQQFERAFEQRVPLLYLMMHRSFPVLVLFSGAAVTFLFGRIALTRTLDYSFLVWNLFLAWIPYFLGVFIEQVHQHNQQHHLRRWWLLLAIGGAWLAFFPNAPYILTDFLHYRFDHSFVWWYDLGLILSFALTGCFLTMASLVMVHRVVEEYAGRVVGWGFVFATFLLSGFGIYIGRVLRWNSWDILTHPWALFNDIVLYAHPLRNLHAAGIIIMFATLLSLFYLAYRSRP